MWITKRSYSFQVFVLSFSDVNAIASDKGRQFFSPVLGKCFSETSCSGDADPFAIIEDVKNIIFQIVGCSGFNPFNFYSSYQNRKVFFLKKDMPIASCRHSDRGTIGYTHIEASRIVYVFRPEHGVSTVSSETVSFPSTALPRLNAYLSPSFWRHFETKLQQARTSSRRNDDDI